MADSSDGGGGRGGTAVLTNHLTLADNFLGVDNTSEKEKAGGSRGSGIFRDILQMEPADQDLKDEDSSFMEALAECEEKAEDNIDDDAEYMSGDEEEEEDEEEEGEGEEEEDEGEEENEDDDEQDGDSSSAEASDNNDFNVEKASVMDTEDPIDFGTCEMPDFSVMMEADGSSLLEGAVTSEMGIKGMQEADFAAVDDSVEGNEALRAAGKAVMGKSREDAEKKKKKRKRKPVDKDKKGAKKPKKERKSKKKGGKSKKEKSNVDSSHLKASERRRNIRKILNEKDLDHETLAAQKEELDRQQRLMELKKSAMTSMAKPSVTLKPTMVSCGTGTSVAVGIASGESQQDSQLKSLLQSAEEEAEKLEKKDISVLADQKKEVPIKQEKVDVIELSSESEDEEDDDDCVMMPSTTEEEEDEPEAEDVNNGGSHINDDFNCADEKGRVLVNVGHPAEDPDIYLTPQVARAIKPHQIGGVRFLYDNVVESIERFKTSQGFGCILAHSMGLGKTIQVIAFTDIFLKHTGAKTVLCIVPINTLQNWMAEFNMWAPSKEKLKPPSPPPPPKNSSQRESREKNQRDKSSSQKDSKNSVMGAPTGPYGSSMMPPSMNHMGNSGMSHMGGPGMGQMVGPGMGWMGNHGMGLPGNSGMGPRGGPAMGHMGGAGNSQMGGPGMGHMGGAGSGQMGGSGMGQMGGPGMGQMGNQGMGQVCGAGMGSMSNSGMGQMGNPGVGQMSGPGMGHIGGPGMGHMGGPNMAGMGSQGMGGIGKTDMGQMGGSGMGMIGTQGIGQMGSSSMSYMGQMGMHSMGHMGNPSMGSMAAPWMNSGMGAMTNSQHGFMGNMGPPPPPPMGMSSMMPPGQSSSTSSGNTPVGNSSPPAMPPPGSQPNSLMGSMGFSSANSPMGMPPAGPVNNAVEMEMGKMTGDNGDVKEKGYSENGCKQLGECGENKWIKEEKIDIELEKQIKENGENLSKSMDNIKKEKTDKPEIVPREYHVYLLNDSCKTTSQRAKILGEWTANGGVLLMGYEMFRLLSSRRYFTQKPKKKKKKNSSASATEDPEVIDVDEEDKNKNLMTDIHSALVNPGPDLVICDEGHRIKNNHAGISQSLKQVKTKRRVVLTGYPLQNNLMEYWCMVDFVRPSFLGTKTEFSNMFERPIMNGQCHDSTSEDLKIMRHRAYVLHNLLEGFVQRRGHTVLKKALPQKTEYVFMIRMSPIQRKLYRRFMESLETTGMALANSNPLRAFSIGCKIWNHPDILHKSVMLKKPVTEENDLDIEASEVTGSKKKLKKSDSSSSLASTASMSSIASSASVATATSTSTVVSMATSASTVDAGIGTGSDETTPSTASSDKKEEDNAWVGDAFEEYEAGLMEHGPKMVILNTIVEECLKVGDKILVFSQSLSTLDTIEEFLSKQKVPRPDLDETWAKGKSYLRLDGSTSGTERERLINEFNHPDNKTAWVFLLSTRAGCLGINLIGANRVIVLDASWNPCHDCQAVCRVYRFGQTKPCFIYRLVTENTLERNIYDRQITKQGMSDRVIDEMNPDNHFSKGQLENLLKSEDKDHPYLDFSCSDDVYDDAVLVSVLKKQGQWLTKEPFSHESLLIDRKELRLSKREKQLAKEGYARDKRMNISYSRPSYAAYYPGGGSQMYIRRGPVSRPIASVRPMMSTPVPRPTIQVVKPGVTVHQVITTTDILLPGTTTTTSSGTPQPNKIASGQKILVIKTPKGVYIRTNDGKMFAVRSKAGNGDGDGTTGTASTSTVSSGVNTTTTVTAATTGTKTLVTTVSAPPRIFYKMPDGKLTEKSPHDVGSGTGAKAGASLLASLYTQTKAVNSIIQQQALKKGQITQVVPAAPHNKIFARKASILSSGAGANSKAPKPPVEVIVYPRAKVISTGRACKAGDSKDDAAKIPSSGKDDSEKDVEEGIKRPDRSESSSPKSSDKESSSEASSSSLLDTSLPNGVATKKASTTVGVEAGVSTNTGTSQSSRVTVGTSGIMNTLASCIESTKPTGNIYIVHKPETKPGNQKTAAVAAVGTDPDSPRPSQSKSKRKRIPQPPASALQSNQTKQNQASQSHTLPASQQPQTPKPFGQQDQQFGSQQQSSLQQQQQQTNPAQQLQPPLQQQQQQTSSLPQQQQPSLASSQQVVPPPPAPGFPQQHQAQQQQPQPHHQQHYPQAMPDFMSEQQPLLPSQTSSHFHQPWGQSSLPLSYPDFNQPHHQLPPQHQQPQHQQLLHGQQQQPSSAAHHLPAAGQQPGNAASSSMGKVPSSSYNSSHSVNQGQEQEASNQPAMSSAFRPPTGDLPTSKSSEGLNPKKSPTPPQSQQQHHPMQQQHDQPQQQQPPSQPPPSQQQTVAHPQAQHQDGRYDNWWPEIGGGSSSGSHHSQGMGGMSGPSSSSSSSSSYQSPHSAFTPMGHSYFHHGFTPFGMHPSPQSNFSMMSQGLGMPGSYPFIPSFHPGFMGHPFSQGLGTSSGNSFSSSGSSAGGFGFGQGQETMGSFRALLEDSPERTLTDQQSASSSISNSIGGGGLSASSPEGNAMSMPGVSSAGGSSGMGSGGGFGNSSSSMSGLPHASMQSSSNAMYGYSPMSLGYAGLSPMLGMSNPMFMPVMPSSMMGQHYPMQHGPGAPGGPLSAMGHMAAMGAHLSGSGAGMPPSSGN